MKERFAMFPNALKVCVIAAAAAVALSAGCDSRSDSGTGSSSTAAPTGRSDGTPLNDRTQSAVDIKGPPANTSSHTAGSQGMTDSQGSQNYNAGNPDPAGTKGSNANGSGPNGVAQGSAGAAPGYGGAHPSTAPAK